MDLRLAATFLLMAGLLSGCVDGEGGLSGGPAVDGEPAGSAGGHGETTVDEGAPSARRTGDGRWTASRTVTVSNGFGGASRASLDLQTVNGAVAVGPGSGSAYRAAVQLSATADTEAQAREALATLSVSASDELTGRLLQIGVEVEFARYEARDVSRSGSITLTVPDGPAYNVEAATVNGEVRFADLRGDAFSASTVNGGIEVDGVRGRSLSASSSNGEVEVEGQFDDVEAEATNGDIEAILRPGGSGRYAFETVNGGIELLLERESGQGYDVTADTVNGGIDLDLGGAEPVGSQSRTHKHVQTSGYSGAAVRTEVSADTVNGGIVVEDA